MSETEKPTLISGFFKAQHEREEKEKGEKEEREQKLQAIGEILLRDTNDYGQTSIEVIQIFFREISPEVKSVIESAKNLNGLMDTERDKISNELEKNSEANERKKQQIIAERLYFKFSSVPKMLNVFADSLDLFRKDYPSQLAEIRAISLMPLKLKTDKFESREGKFLRDLAKEVQLKIGEIYNHRPFLDDDKDATAFNVFSMERIKSFIATLQNDFEKLKYLKKIKKSFLENDKQAMTYRNGEITFYAPPVLNHFKKTREDFFSVLEREIEFYESFYSGKRVNEEPAAKSIEDNTKNKNNKTLARHNDSTIDRTIFLLNYLIPSFSQCKATEKAKFINFLTGFDEETVRQRFSSINKKELESPKAFKVDFDIICKYLTLLGLDSVVEKVKKDLDFS